MSWRGTLKKLALSLGSLLAFGALLEVAARVAEPGPFSLLDSNPYRPHPELDYVHAPDFAGRWDSTWYSTNSLGMRGPEVPAAKADDELRIVCLGDSCTFGKGVAEADSWPRQLERLLADELDGQRPVVLNLGVNGYSGSQYRGLFLERGVQLEPDVVVIGYNLNDFPNVVRAVDQEVFNERGLRRLLPQGLRDRLGRLALYRYVRAAFYDRSRERDWQRAEAFARRAAETPGDSEVWERQEGYLREIREAAEAVGARVLVLLFPYESQVYLDSYDTRPIDILRERCARLEIPFVSLEREFRERAREEDPPRELFLRGDRYHPRPEGYRIVAECVVRALRERGWLSR